MRYNIYTDSGELIFYQLPKVIQEGEKYKDLSVPAKYLYMLMYDVNKLSKENEWLDNNGDIYIYYSVDRIMNDMNVSKKKAIALKRELAKFKLIEEVRQGLNKPNKIYINKALGSESNQRKYENGTSVSCENGIQKDSEIHPNNNKYNNNKRIIKGKEDFSFNMDIDY